MAPTLYSDHKYSWINENQKTTYALFHCISRGDCAQNQTKVVLIAQFDFIDPMEGGFIGGEAIWAGSTIRALDNMGYSVLYARNLDTAGQLYTIYGHLVKMVIASPGDIEHCVGEERCARTAANPAGIPLWKFFAFHFWSQAAHPLGSKWTLSPEDYHTNSYLGYSIEAQCSRYPFILHSERKRQAYILAKFLNFFTPEQRAWQPDFFDAAANATRVSFVMASVELSDMPKLRPGELSPSIENIARAGELFSQDEFYHILSHSVALVGVGHPEISPTPYDALCLGVPFVNPIVAWDTNDPNDRTRWTTQHDLLIEFSAPYVYHVFKGDRDGFVNAIKSAAENPIESYVLERMKIGSVEYRLGKILEHDWRAEAAELLQARKAGLESGNLFEL
ncbi:hypothetical protein B0H14DRAFT_477129 [Mycena olivaceomarginata]|nr:hypothetical protein B0H14DRAFT_477129 [Mycena olivaceomarginata]